MIARTWHGRVPAAKADAYLAYLKRTGIPDYQKTPGNQGVYVFRRIEGKEAHFLLTSLWDSLEVIRAFAGEDVERARYYPEDTEYLLELEPTVTHYEVLVDTTSRITMLPP
ncbi:MAG: antibiotic biosynthesis monooxygenase family protein [Gemmatimonadales bacterium]